MGITITPDDITIDNDEFYESLNQREIEELVKWMIRDGHIKPGQSVQPVSVMEDEYLKSLNKLSLGYHQLKLEDQEIVKLLAKKVVI